MRIAISIEHPAWAHQFRRIIQQVNETGESLVLAVDKDGDLQLLDSFGINYELLANSTGRNVFEKAYLFCKLCISYSRAVKRFNPDILIGRASPMMAVAAFFSRKPHLIFEDTEVSRFSLEICKRLSTRILTPKTFHLDLGEKQCRLPIYKELFYLHRDFVPDKNVVKAAGIDIDCPYAVVRFIAWDASHDVGMHSISDARKIDIVRKLSSMLKVYISSETALPEALQGYQIKAPFDKIHHILYYATVVISEGASMASEAAILGTHSFYLNEIASATTEEQEEKYHLLRVLHDPKTRYDTAIKETEELLKNQNIWEEGKKKRERILAEMPNPNEIFMQMMQELVNLNGVE